ncbi:MAG: hypothetical protein WC707_05780, partial [Candidatus Babeliaceae bacterium]
MLYFFLYALCIFPLSHSMDNGLGLTVQRNSQVTGISLPENTPTPFDIEKYYAIPQHLRDAGVIAMWKCDDQEKSYINDLMNYNSIINSNGTTFMLKNSSPLLIEQNTQLSFTQNHNQQYSTLLSLPDFGVAIVHTPYQDNLPSQFTLPSQDANQSGRVNVDFFSMQNPSKGLLELLPEYNAQAYKKPEVSFDIKQSDSHTIQRRGGFTLERATWSHGDFYTTIKPHNPEPYIVQEQPQETGYTEQEVERIKSVAKETQTRYHNYLATNRQGVIQERINDYAQSLIGNKGDLRAETAHQGALRNELVRDITQLEQKIIATNEHLKNLPPISDRSELVHAYQTQIALDKMQLALEKTKDDIEVLKHAMAMNEEYLRITSTIAEKGTLDGQSLSECKVSLTKLLNRKKQIEADKIHYAREQQRQIEAVDKIEKTLQTHVARSIKHFGHKAWKYTGYEGLQEKQNQHTKAIQSADISYKEKENDLKIIEEAITHCTSLINQREQENFRTLAQRIYKGEQNVELSKDAKNSALIQSVQQHIQEFGALHKEVFSLNDQTYNVLENLGAKVPETCVIEYEGNRVQLHVYGELINSLNNMGSVNLARLEVQQLLKQAVIINNSGRKLVGEHKIDQALSAKLACDALVNYAKTIGDLGLAVGEGVVEGTASVMAMPGNFSSAIKKGAIATGQGTLYAVTYPKETCEHVKNTYDKAVLAVSGHIAEVRKTYATIWHGGEEFEKLQAQWDADSKRHVEDHFENRPAFRDQVKATTKFLTECVLLEGIGGALVKSAGEFV